MATADEFGEIDPDEAPSSLHRRRWPIAAAVVVVVVIVGVVAGLLAWRPWSNNDARVPSTTAPGLMEELVIDLPGFSLVQAVEGGGDLNDDVPSQGYLFATADADLENGPLLAFLVDDLAEGEELDSGDETIEINGHNATVEQTGESIEIYWEGEPGVRYGVAGAGVSRARVIAFAAAVSFENGVTVVDPAVVEGLEPAGDIATFFAILGMVQPLFSSAADIPPVQQYRSAEDQTVTLASIAAPGEFLGLAALVMVDERILDVNGTTVVVGSLADGFRLLDGQRFLLAERGGRLIGITGFLDDDGMLALLAAVRPATDEEWAAVLAALVNPLEAFENDGGDDVSVDPTMAADTQP